MRENSQNFSATTVGVEWVNYTGFVDSPYHTLAKKYLNCRARPLLTFGVKGGFEAAPKGASV
jgi:O-acetylhomoserine (thiol)-lyase